MNRKMSSVDQKEEAEEVNDEAVRRVKVPVKEVEKRLRRLLQLLDCLLVRCYKKRQLGEFLTLTVDEFRPEKDGSERKGEVALKDRLTALR